MYLSADSSLAKKEDNVKSRKWILSCFKRLPNEAINIPSLNIENIINKIVAHIKNLYKITGVKENNYQHLFYQVLDVFEKINLISEVNRISNIPQYEFKHFILILEYFWESICEYYAVKFWFFNILFKSESVDYFFKSVLLEQEYHLSHISIELIESKTFLRHISHYYDSCNYWRQLNTKLRFLVIETGKNMFVKLEAQSVTISKVLININDEILLEKHRLRSKLQLFKLMKFLTIVLILICVILFHYFTMYLNAVYNFHFPDIGITLICLLGSTEIISNTSACWDPKNLNINLQIFFLILLWIIISVVVYCVYIYAISFFELQTFAILEDYANLRQKLKLINDEYVLVKRFTMISL